MTYDVTVRESFVHVKDWLVDVNKYAQEDTCKLLIGNKSDRQDRVVATEEGVQLGKDLQVRPAPRAQPPQPAALARAHLHGADLSPPHTRKPASAPTPLCAPDAILGNQRQD